jgi:hypothetical protein
MSKNTNKRVGVKWIRDKAKKAYEKADHCFICDTTQDLELHHLHSLTILLETWAKNKGYDITTDEGVLAIRDEFIEQHYHELYELVYTLCYKHHSALHGVYGKAPAVGSEPKQDRWIKLQREKFLNKHAVLPSTGFGSFFSEFI